MKCDLDSLYRPFKYFRCNYSRLPREKSIEHMHAHGGRHIFKLRLVDARLENQVQTNGLVTNLSENDEYVPCVGEISMRCLRSANHAWEGHANDLRIFLAFIKCYAGEEETPTCNFPIARHINAFVQSFRKHMEENHGLLSGMLKEIKQ